MVRKSTEIRQEEIKKAVLNIIKDSGIKAVSTKNLSKEIGLSEGAIFRHFKSKKEIISSIIDDVSNDLVEKLKIISEQEDEPEAKLYNYLCATISYLLENNGITILLFSEAAYNNDSDMIQKLNYIFSSQKEYFKVIINEGIQKDIWDDSVSLEDLAILYMGIPITLNINLILNSSNFNKKDFCLKMKNLLIKILSK